jgi:hypothetical protein
VASIGKRLISRQLFLSISRFHGCSCRRGVLTCRELGLDDVEHFFGRKKMAILMMLV